MSAPTWKDVDNSVRVMVECLNDFEYHRIIVQEYLDNIDASKLRTKDAKLFKESYDLCGIMKKFHCMVADLSVTMFKKIQKAKGRALL